ncbi:MAG: CD0519/CD1768 family membrane protein [Planctomycetota bacterium]
MRKIKAFDIKTILLFAGLLGTGGFFCQTMGCANFFSTLMATAHNLLLNTALFILALSVLAGALGAFMAEFGILALLNWMLAPAIRLFWGLPGAAAVGAITTFVSDNPAIIALAKDKQFTSFFRRRQLPALTNFGTSFGMGLIVVAFMMSHGFFLSTFLGVAGAVVGSIVSTRLMLFLTARVVERSPREPNDSVRINPVEYLDYREIGDENLFHRFLQSMLDGGKSGLEAGLQVIPGILIICTPVMLLTLDAGTGYDGSAFQGVALLPRIGQWFSPITAFFFGFSTSDAIVFPVTALGSVGAALAVIPKFIANGIIGHNEVAVYTAMGMVWSGFLSTHIAMMDALGFRELASRAIAAHAVGGVSAGFAAHLLVLGAGALL